MSELSIFIDESGDFGEYDYHSPYYIITMVFHNQDRAIADPMARLEEDLGNLGAQLGDGRFLGSFCLRAYR